jgi:insulysin
LNKEHPFSNFFTGSKDTLQKEGIRNELLDFYNKYYSSHIMKLAISGQDSLDIMKQKV